ncbi:MAG: twin-arginine translocase TatA/TatE family subunit [Zetaproteobacteria bacterium]|nr:MAG: twin-arginine translocase TatA/TatE family subunit [Zetaproteobacteria bacterium]
MPEIGIFELLLIGLVGFVVLGPERIPEFFRQIVSMVRTVRRWFFQMKEQIEIERMLIAEPVEEGRKAVEEAVAPLREPSADPPNPPAHPRR